MKRIFTLILIILIAISLLLIYVSYLNNQWSTITASISLIITLIASFFLFEMYHNHIQMNRPQLVVRLDFKSRDSLALLVIENLGKRPAFNIKFRWKEELTSHNGKKCCLMR